MKSTKESTGTDTEYMHGSPIQDKQETIRSSTKYDSLSAFFELCTHLSRLHDIVYCLHFAHSCTLPPEVGHN